MNETPPMFAPETYPCNECPAGVMHLRHITYFTWLSEELVTVPNFPAWVCDMCGKREYDEQAISWLTMLLSPNAGKPTRRFKRTRQPGSRKPNLSRPPSMD
ncbi:MAG: YgiT-type zinc finger protein [Anaerolineales bacterium]